MCGTCLNSCYLEAPAHERVRARSVGEGQVNGRDSCFSETASPWIEFVPKLFPPRGVYVPPSRRSAAAWEEGQSEGQDHCKWAVLLWAALLLIVGVVEVILPGLQ